VKEGEFYKILCQQKKGGGKSDLQGKFKQFGTDSYKDLMLYCEANGIICDMAQLKYAVEKFFKDETTKGNAKNRNLAASQQVQNLIELEARRNVRDHNQVVREHRNFMKKTGGGPGAVAPDQLPGDIMEAGYDPRGDLRKTHLIPRKSGHTTINLPPPHSDIQLAWNDNNVPSALGQIVPSGLSFSLPGVQSGVSGAAVRSTVGLPLSSANIISDIEGSSDAAAGESLSGVPGVVYYDAAGVCGGSRSDVGQPLSSAVGQPLSRASSKSPVGQPLSRASSQSSYEGMSDTSEFRQSVDSTPRQQFTNLEKERCRVMEEGQKRREDRADEICVSSKRIKTRELEIMELEKTTREERNRELHELKMFGEKARQDMEQRILAEELRIKQFLRMKVEMEMDVIKSNKK